jgi:2-keto-3-deoxy-L-rhamnonate aldolase RhmA
MPTLKQRLQAGEATVGSWLMLGSASAAEVLAGAGFDWVVVDLEHSATTERETEDIFRAIELKGSVPLVRLTSNNPDQIKRVLDSGAQGIIVPMVKNADDARTAVAAAHYPPEGRRSFALSRAQGYGPGFQAYVNEARDRTLVVALIEHVDAINNLDEILAVEGIDATMIGPYDLSGSVGKPGRFDDPEVIALVDRYTEASRAAGVPYGYHVVSTDYAAVEAKLAEGFRFVVFSTDTLFLGATARSQMQRRSDTV